MSIFITLFSANLAIFSILSQTFLTKKKIKQYKPTEFEGFRMQAELLAGVPLRIHKLFIPL